MHLLQLSHLLPLRYRHGFHSRLDDLNRPLRYFLGGIRPKQTTHQKLSLCDFVTEVSGYISTEWYFTGDSSTTEIMLSKSPTYATQYTRRRNFKL